MGFLDFEKWCWPIGDSLDEKTIRRYARHSNCSIYDAIILSIGFNPPRSIMFNDFMKKIDPAALLEERINSPFKERWESIEDLLASEELTCFRYPRKYEGLAGLGVDLRGYISLLKAKGLPYPQELEEIVMRTKTLRIGEVINQAKKIEGLQVITLKGETLSQIVKVPDQSKSQKNSVFSDLGKKKGKLMRDFVAMIYDYAINEYERNCKCSQGELADHLMQLKRGDGVPLFPDPRPVDKRRIPLRDSFVEAAGKARKARGLLLKGEKGYTKEICERHSPRR